jgi:hypothetical protein
LGASRVDGASLNEITRVEILVFGSLQLKRGVLCTTDCRKEDSGEREGAMIRSRAQPLEITMLRLAVQVMAD